MSAITRCAAADARARATDARRGADTPTQIQALQKETADALAIVAQRVAGCYLPMTEFVLPHGWL
jgi:hypothetical protein